MLDLRQYFDSYIAVLRRVDHAAVRRMAQFVFAAWERRRTVFLCGNGGNSANAAHIAADLVKLTAPPRGPRLRAVALGESLAGLSAVANDIAYEEVFAEQLRAFLSPGDLVIGLSTSGSSPNVLRAVEHANQMGALTLGITGLKGAKLQACAQHPIVVASTSVQQIEDATMLVGHLVCLMVRDLVLAAVEEGRRVPGAREVPADLVPAMISASLASADRPLGSERRPSPRLLRGSRPASA
jgi:D-sedoheptulose 7-phosphate isomerase